VCERVPNLCGCGVKFFDHLNGCQFHSKMVLQVFVDVAAWSWSDRSLLVGLVQVQRVPRKLITRRFIFPLFEEHCCVLEHNTASNDGLFVSRFKV
jgi:hypothetical protein